MTADQLRYFITIVDTGSYMAASLDLNISQSSISKQIQSLENELGISLFDRKSRKARLTPEGEKILPEVRITLERIDHLLYSAAKLKTGYTSHLSIITLPFIGYLGFYNSLSRFEAENPRCRLNVTEMEEPQLMRQLLNNHFDIAITYEHEYQCSNLNQEFIPITTDEIVIVVHKNNPLSKQKAISPQELAGSPLLLMESYTCIAKLCKSYFEEQNFIPNIALRGKAGTIFCGAEAQRGIAVLTQKQALRYVTQNTITLPLIPAVPVVIGAVLGRELQNIELTRRLLNLLTPDCT